MSSNHPTAEDLVAHLDGELAAEVATGVAAHVTACDTCRHETDLLRASAALLSRLPARQPSSDFTQRVLAAAREESAAPRGLLRFPRPLLQAAAALLIAAAGFAAWSLRGANDAPITPGGDETAVVLTQEEEEAIAREMLLLGALEFLEDAETDELKLLVEDLDVLDALAAEDPDPRSGG